MKESHLKSKNVLNGKMIFESQLRSLKRGRWKDLLKGHLRGRWKGQWKGHWVDTLEVHRDQVEVLQDRV